MNDKYTVNKDATVKPAIVSCMDRLSTNLNELTNGVEMLAKKLSPVIRQVSTNGKDKDIIEETSGCQLADQIVLQINRVRDLHGRVQALIELCEL